MMHHQIIHKLHIIKYIIKFTTSLNILHLQICLKMDAMSLTRLYMHVVPVLDIRVMLLIYPPSLNHIFKSD